MIFAETTRGEWVHAEYSEGITDGVPNGKHFIMVIIEKRGTDPSEDKRIHLDPDNAQELISSIEAALGMSLVIESRRKRGSTRGF